jgi:glycyl-tRNA synthetase beta chain
MKAPLLIEIGCEEIPARMIARAADDLGTRVTGILDSAGLDHGAAISWGGSRRLTVRVEEVDGSQEDRVSEVLGPPAKTAFDDDGKPTRAAEGFARKQGIDVADLAVIETDKGARVGIRREVRGRGVGAILADELPRAVEAMSFPKSMRWGDGRFRWVRPVHWVLALHGEQPLELELFGIRSGVESQGHRFLGPGPVVVERPDCYVDALRERRVVTDPTERRTRLAELLEEAARSVGGSVVEDAGLLDEVVDLVEWPGVSVGGFDAAYLELPREILVTTLRHHQKCFSVQTGGELLPNFLAVANTDRDPGGHVRRGNEWVVSGRLEDARFFWREDRRRPLAEGLPGLAAIVFHDKAGTFADKGDRMAGLARTLARKVGAEPAIGESGERAARLAKVDLSTALVGEFPELQGVVGGLLLREEGEDRAVADAVYEHYRPAGPDDPLPETPAGCAVAAADKLDTVAELIKAGQRPTGSRDPFGLRRAANGVLRIAIERRWPVSLRDLADLTGGDEAVLAFLADRLVGYLRDIGYTSNEIQAVLRPRIDPSEVRAWSLPDVVARLEAIRTVRDRDDFRHLVKLTERANNIVTKNEELVEKLDSSGRDAYTETEAAAVTLCEMVHRQKPRMAVQADKARYDDIVESLSAFIEPVERFFDDVLVIDEGRPDATSHRYAVVSELRDLLTRYFDIRELAGQAERG